MSCKSEVYKQKLCRCCHSEGEFKSLHSPQYSMDVDKETTKMCLCIATVVYADKLRECFNIELLPVREPHEKKISAICDACIQRLQDANDFKRQVLKCEQELQARYHRLTGEDLVLKVKEEATDCKVFVDDHGAANDGDGCGMADSQVISLHSDIDIKDEVPWMDDEPNDDDAEMIVPDSDVVESFNNEAEVNAFAPKNKRKRKTTNQKEDAASRVTAKRKNDGSPSDEKVDTAEASLPCQAESGPIYLEPSATRTHIAGHMSEYSRQLFLLAYDFARTNDYKFCWYTNGRVFLRKKAGASPELIKEEKQLEKLQELRTNVKSSCTS